MSIDTSAPECLVCFRLLRGEEIDRHVCDGCLEVVAKVHEAKARLRSKTHRNAHACDVCNGHGYNLNSLDENGLSRGIELPRGQLCWACGGTGVK
jgi:hypothetical protein